MFTLSCGNSISKKDLCKNVHNAFLEKLKLKIDEFFHNQVNGKETVIDIYTVMRDCSGRHRLAGKLKKLYIQNLSCLIPFMNYSKAAKPGYGARNQAGSCLWECWGKESWGNVLGNGNVLMCYLFGLSVCVSCVWVQACTCHDMHVEVGEPPWVLTFTSLVIWDRLWAVCCCVPQASWPLNFRDSSIPAICLAPGTPGFRHRLPYLVLYEVWGSELRVSYLCGKGFTPRTIFPVHSLNLNSVGALFILTGLYTANVCDWIKITLQLLETRETLPWNHYGKG